MTTEGRVLSEPAGQRSRPRLLDMAIALVLVGGGVSLLTLVLIQGRLTGAIFAPRAAPLQVVVLLGFAAVLWGRAFRLFRSGFRRLRRPQQAALPLLQAAGLNVAALYLTGFAFILVRLLLTGEFRFDTVNLFEVGGLMLLGLWLSGWGGYDLTSGLWSYGRRMLIRVGQIILTRPLA